MGLRHTPDLKGKQRQSKTALANIRKNGQKIADTPNAIKQTSSSRWKVLSQTIAKMFYGIVLCESGFLFECPNAHGGAKLCKHVAALHLKLTRLWNAKRKKLDINRIRLKCKKCGSRNFEGHGSRTCVRKANTRRYRCKECGATTSGLDGFRGRHFNVITIVTTLSMAACGMTPRQIMDHHNRSGICIHPSTIRRWISHYSRIANAWWATLKVDVGYMWHVDEIEIRIDGTRKYLLAVLDGSSRLVLSYMISGKKDGVRPTRLFAQAAARAVRLPRVLVTDGLLDFIEPAKKVFYRMSGPRFVHIRDIHIQNQFNNNNIYERFNGEIRDLLKRVRGLRGKSPGIIGLMIWNHNCFRRHMGIDDMTPAAAAGITIHGHEDYGGWGDWVTCVQHAAIYAEASGK